MRTPIEVHRNLLGEPTAAQIRLYQSGRRGFAQPLGAADLSEAALMVALAHTFPAKPGDAWPQQRVLVLTPAGSEQTVMESIRAMIKKIITRFSRMGTSVSIREVLKRQLANLIVVQRPFLPNEPPPEPWIALGFTRSSEVPSWMQAELLDP